MRPLRIAAAAAVCLAALTACGPEEAPPSGTARPPVPPPAASARTSPPAAASPVAASPKASATPAAKATGRPSPLPAAVWIGPHAVPLDAVRHWAAPASTARGADTSALAFEQACRTERDPDVVELIGSPHTAVAVLGDGGDREWRARETVVSWGPITSSGAAQNVYAVLQGLTRELEDCAATAPGARVDLAPENEAHQQAATLTVPRPGGGSTELHVYLTMSGGAIAELVVETVLPQGGRPRTAWAAPADDAVLTALARPVCTAFKDC